MTVAQRGAVSVVGVVDPLDDFLAPLVLEVDVDVGWFAALCTDEALEQQAGTRRVDRRDAQHVADRRVGGRTAPLAQDALRFREPDDAVHRQEMRRVVELVDQRQLVMKLADNGVGHAVGVRARGAVPGQRFQRLLRRLPGNAHLGGILVAQRVERKPAPLDDFQRAGNGVRMAGEQPRDFVRRLQVAVRKPLAPEAGGINRAPLADAGEHVLQDAAPRSVVQHVAGRHGGEFLGRGELRKLLQADRVVRPPAQRQRAR